MLGVFIIHKPIYLCPFPAHQYGSSAQIATMTFTPSERDSGALQHGGAINGNIGDINLRFSQ